eukprot:gene12167-12255_t
MSNLLRIPTKDQIYSTWVESVDLPGTPAEDYFLKCRLDINAVSPEALRWHPRLSAIVAQFRSIATGQMQAVSLIHIDAKGQRISSQILGSPSGGAVMFSGHIGVRDHLHVGAGLAPCLAALSGGQWPIWAVGGIKALANFPIIARVNRLTVFSKFGDGGATVQAIEHLARRWERTGREVRIISPSIVGDLVDDLQRMEPQQDAPGWNYQTNKPARKFRFTPWDELDFDPEPSYLVKGILPKCGTACLFGASGSYKSFQAIHLCFSIALGTSWAARKVKQGQIVYVASEGAAGLRKRIVGARQFYGINSAMSCHLISQSVNFGCGAGDMEILASEINAESISPAIIVIDTLAQSLGNGDENGAGMIQFIANITELSSKFKCLVLAVHHVGYSEGGRMRGHSSLIGALDAAILCEGGKGSLSSELTLIKSKDDESGLKFTANLERVDLGFDSDGDPISTLVVTAISEGGKAAPTVTQAKDTPSMQRLLMDAFHEAVSEHGTDHQIYGGPKVTAVAERFVRDVYYNRLAENPKPDDDADKLAERQRKNWNNSIKRLLDSMRLIAGQASSGERILCSRSFPLHFTAFGREDLGKIPANSRNLMAILMVFGGNFQKFPLLFSGAQMAYNSEAKIQAAIVEWVRTVAPETVIFAVPNGGLRTKPEAALLRWTGVLAGIPDLCLIANAKPYFIEVKTEAGKVSEAQRAMLLRLTTLGAGVAVVHSIDETRNAFEGQSGNPKGMPKGTRHKVTRAAEALLDGQAEALTAQAVTMALNGDPVALRLCLERILPPRKDRPIVFDMPKLVTVGDASKGVAAILAGAAAGDLTPSEASALAGLVSNFVRTVEVVELERRLTALESMKDTDG